MVSETDQAVQIILSFFLTAVLSLGCVTAAFFDYGIQSSEYAHLDKIIVRKMRFWLKRGEARRPIADDDPLSPYQAFLLAMSDQALMTGIGSLIALYAQMCNELSMFSFLVGVSLARFCAGIHLCTLTALRTHLKHNRKQAIVRIFLMLILLIISLPSISLQTILSGWPPTLSAACGIRLVRDSHIRYHSLEFTTLSMYMAYGQLTSMIYMRPRTPEQQILQEARYSPIISIMFWLPWNSRFEQDLKLALVKRQDDITERKSKASNKIKGLTGIDAVVTMLPYLWWDTSGSLVIEICTHYVWFALTIKEVVDQLKVDIDLTPLFSWKYGQLMPMILILAYILTAVEAASDRGAEQESHDERRPKAVVAQPSQIGINDSQMSGSNQAFDNPLPRSSPGDDQARTTGSQPLVSPKSHGPHHEALRNTTSLPVTHAPTPPTRHDTVSIEAQDKYESQYRGNLDVMGVALETHKGLVHKWTVLILIPLLALEVFTFFFFEITVLIMTGIWLLKHTVRTILFFRFLHQVRRDRSRARLQGTQASQNRR